MRLECQSGRNGGPIANRIVDSGILISDRERTSDRQIGIVRYLAEIPNRVAGRVSIILTLSVVGGTIQEAMEIHFFAWVIIVDVLTITRDIVSAVFDAEDASGLRVFSNPNRVAKAPAEKCPTTAEVVGLSNVKYVESLDLAVPRVDLFRKYINVGSASSANKEQSWNFL